MDYAKNACTSQLETTQFYTDRGLDGFRHNLDQFWDGVLPQVARAVADPGLREIYRVLLTQARQAALDTKWLAEPQTFISLPEEGKQGQSGREKLMWWSLSTIPPFKQIIGFLTSRPTKLFFLTVAALSSAACLVWFLLQKEKILSYTAIAPLAVLLVCCLVELRKPRRKGTSWMRTRVEQRVNVDYVQKALKTILSNVDADAENLYAQLNQTTLADTSPEGLGLATELIKLAYSSREKMPEAVMSKLKLFFASNDIQVIPYTPDKKNLFTLLPSNADHTIEPALVKQDGTILSLGTACSKEAF